MNWIIYELVHVQTGSIMNYFIYQLVHLSTSSFIPCQYNPKTLKKSDLITLGSWARFTRKMYDI